ncbi:MAG TPA: PAS domain-containing sensor histidine kinase [Chitinophagaceae bacterium]|nr:PAS domain-containing sensor histidine kinase [Chitinophagaceae bacterium]
MNTVQSYDTILTELEELRLKLQEANDTLDAIRNGQVDALVVKNGDGHQLYTLKSADQTYRVFIEKMKEGAVTLNHDEIILYSNSQFASMVGLPLAKATGLRFSDFIPTQSKESFRDLIERGWESDSKGEVLLINKNKELIPFLLSFTSLELDEGKALSIILTDLSVQKENERQLQQKNIQLEEARYALSKINEHLEELVTERTRELFLSREHFRFLADNIPVIVWTTRPDGNIDYYNKQWFEYTGLSFEQSVKSPESVIHPDDFEPARAAWQQAVTHAKTFEWEYRLKRAIDGAYRWHLGKGQAFRDKNDQIIAWFGTSTDIEDQKKEIERKDEFISVASHELKTPLTSLKGYLQLMQCQPHLPDDTKLYISKGNISINKLQHLINDLLDVSKIKSGKLEFDKNLVDLDVLVENCIENSSYMYPAYHIRKEGTGKVMVIGNAERLEQVIMNLVNNAVKYSPGIHDIIVRVETVKDCGKVSVIDQGVGMSAADQKRIFERFYRSDHNKFIASGLGMGLYISAEIIKEHDGTMSVSSRLNEGSVFSFSVPLAGAPPKKVSSSSRRKSSMNGRK